MGRTKKRKRVSKEYSNGDKTATNPPPKHADLLWFNDGNIVLVAQDTAFRVHKGVLALHSEVFRNMFGDVNQPEGAEVFDGCPVVRLSDESEALETFLKTLYILEQISDHDPEDDEHYFPHVLRLATKYICDTIRRRALDAVRRKYYPDTLSAWDDRDDSLDPEDIIGLARDIKADILLPAAFYELCQETQPEPEVHPDAVMTYFVGKAKLGAFWPGFLQNQIVHCKEPPCNHSRCKEGWTTFLEKKTVETLMEFQLPLTDPLAQFDKCTQDIQKVKGVCSETKKIIGKLCDEKRVEIWNELPEIFGLDSWAKMRAAEGLCDDQDESSDSSGDDE